MVSYNISDLTSLGIGLGLLIVIFLFIFVVAYAIGVIPLWFIFKKAGIEPWKALIPIYNSYLTYELFWDTKWFWILLGAAFASGLFSSVAVLGGLISFAMGAFSIYCGYMLAKGIAYSFGQKTTGFVLLTFFFSLIMYYVYAFGDYKYKKAQI